jgi:uncharacterized protein YciI
MSQLYVLVCEDKPNHLALREQTLPAHMLYVAQQKYVHILHSGVTLDYKMGTANGAVIFVLADDLKCVGDFVAHDPFATAGLYVEVKIKRWDSLVNLPEVREHDGRNDSRSENSLRVPGESGEYAPRPEGPQKLLRRLRVAKAALAKLAFAPRLVATLRAVVQPDFRFDEHKRT